jgi:hypothetical protein
MIPLRFQAEAETRAALEGIVTALDGAALPAELGLVPMRLYGDALRLGLDAPKELRAWAAGVSPSLLDDVLRATLALLDGRIPAAGVKDAADDPTIATRLRERDHAESVLYAVRRVCLPRPMAQLEAHAAVITRLGEVDRAFAAVLSRFEATTLLGVRAGLGAGWAQSFPDDEGARGGEDDLLELLRGARPSPALVACYVESGAMRKLVEDAADADADFAEELADTIEAMSNACQAGFAARGWLKRFAKGRAAATALSFSAPELADAAASEVGALNVIEHRLGALFSDVGAEAKLFVGEREIALEIDFEPGTIASIELGSEKVSPNASDESCRLVVSRSGGKLFLRVRATSGQEISEELAFHTGDL